MVFNYFWLFYKMEKYFGTDCRYFFKYYLTHELKPPRRSRGGFNEWVKWLSRNQSDSSSGTFIHVSSNHIKLYIDTRVILTTDNINWNKLFINFTLYKQISRRDGGWGGGRIDAWTSVFNWDKHEIYIFIY